MKTPIAISAIAGAVALFLGGCKSYDVSLTYSPPPAGKAVKRGPKLVEVGRVSDLRDVRGREIGAIRNEVGIPIKRLYAKRPIAQITHNAFGYALDIRGMLAKKSAKYVLSADILELWCHQYATQDAGCRMRVTVTRKSDNRPVFTREYQAKRSYPTASVTYWSRVEEVAAVTSEALQAVVDTVIDDPQYRRALR